MAYSPNIHLTLLLLVALAHQLYGIEVTEETIAGTPARPILYKGLSEELHELIGTYISVVGTGEPLYGLPVYPVHTDIGEPPARWIPIDIVGRDELVDRTRLLMRDDDEFLVGFTNWTGHYHLLQEQDQHMIPDATVVQNGLGYRDILGLYNRDLPELPLSKDLFLDGTHTLGAYPAVSGDEMDTALARFVAMIPFAARIKAIRQRISDNWGVGECHLDEVQANYAAHSGIMCLSLFCEERDIPLTGASAVGLRLAGVSSAQEVKDILGIVLRPKRFNPDNAEQSCAPPDAAPIKPQAEKERRT